MPLSTTAADDSMSTFPFATNPASVSVAFVVASQSAKSPSIVLAAGTATTDARADSPRTIAGRSAATLRTPAWRNVPGERPVASMETETVVVAPAAPVRTTGEGPGVPGASSYSRPLVVTVEP